MKKLALVATILVAGTFSVGAAARPTYPYHMAQELGMTCLPQCTVCHYSNPGNGDNVGQPFADWLVYEDGDAKRMPATDDELIAALENYPADIDSDFDGHTNLDEVTADPPTDPNSKTDPVEVCQPPTKYGCGAASFTGAQPTSSAWPEMLGLVALLAAFGLRRRPAHH